MNVRGLAMAAIVFGCISATELDRPSAAGYTTVLIRGAAKNLVLVDPRGRTCRADAISGEVTIPGSNYWDGSELEFSEGVAMIELKIPVIGRYRVFATATGKPGPIIVTVTSIPTKVELRREMRNARGRVCWNLDFLADTSGSHRPFRLSQGAPVATHKR
jgi:hypothetical protein